jgi:hypothetical protein
MGRLVLGRPPLLRLSDGLKKAEAVLPEYGELFTKGRSIDHPCRSYWGLKAT